MCSQRSYSFYGRDFHRIYNIHVFMFFANVLSDVVVSRENVILPSKIDLHTRSFMLKYITIFFYYYAKFGLKREI